jgi:hypothetical protein
VLDVGRRRPKAVVGSSTGDVAGIVAVWVFYALLVAGVAYLASSYRRSAFWWAILAIVFTPIVAGIFLLVAGVPAELPSPAPEEVDFDGRTTCQSCGAAVDWDTHQGLHSPEDEPWRLLCDNCGHEIEVAT